MILLDVSLFGLMLIRGRERVEECQNIVYRDFERWKKEARELENGSRSDVLVECD